MAPTKTFKSLSRQAGVKKLLSRESFENDPWKLARQWHIWANGERIVSVIRSKSGWAQGPELQPGDLRKTDELRRAAVVARAGAKSPLGIILHVTSDFTVTTVKPAAGKMTNVAKSRATLLDQPQKVLDERPTSDAVYGLLPLPASDRSVAMRLPQERVKSFSALARDPDFRVGAYCAPLEMLIGIAELANPPADVAMASAVVSIYAKLTTIAIITQRGLASFVSMPTPTNDPQTSALDRLGDELNLTNVGKCEVAIVDLTVFHEDKTAEILYRDYFSANPSLTEKVSEINYSDLNAITELAQIENNPLIPIEAYSVPKDAEKWLRGPKNAQLLVEAARQNLLELSGTGATISASENAAIVGSWAMKAAGILALIGGIGYFGWAGYQAVNSPSWKLPTEKATEYSLEAARLNQIEMAATAWRAALQPRSQAWATMELASRLLPENTGARLTRIEYECLPVGEANTEATSLRRKIILSGIAPSGAKSYLESLTTKSVRQALTTIAEFNRSPSSVPAAETSPPDVTTVRVETGESQANQFDLPLGFTLEVIENLPKGALPPSLPVIPPMDIVLKPALSPLT